MAQNKQLVKHHQLESFILSDKNKAFPGITLIYGESYLVKKALTRLTDFLLGEDTSKLAVDSLEGGFVSMGDIIEQVSTFSFLMSKKIVVVKNIPLFQTQQKNQEIRFSTSDIEHFTRFIENGLPGNHFLILTVAGLDKRKKIYKTIEANGLVIDCAVASGSRKADLDEQRSVMQFAAKTILNKVKKKIDNPAFNALLELNGFNLDLLSQNLNKLIAYTGQRDMISLSDVTAVIKREKKDPIFNLTNAVLEKDVTPSIFYLNSLLDEGFHPLQILKSFENQFRKLILVKCCAQTLLKNSSMRLKSMNFNSFKHRILPGIIAYDKQTKSIVEKHALELFGSDSKKKKSAPLDLLLAPNPKNAYPVFLVFQKSENFSLTELYHALQFLSDLDYRMKSSSFDEKTQIENFIIQLCRKGGFAYDAQEY